MPNEIMHKDEGQDSNSNFEMDTQESLDKKMSYFFRHGYGKDIETPKYCIKKAKEGNKYAMLWLARMYRDGKGIEKDIIKSAEWMRRAADGDINYAKNELFDVLWRIGTLESYNEMIEVASAFAESGDGGAMGRLGRAYRYGRGVERDIDKAIDWMRKASNKNIWWAKNELFDMLWYRNYPDDTLELKSLIEKSAQEGDSNALLRLGRMYRYGKGINRDLNKAIDLMKKASDSLMSAKYEYVDLLL